MSTSTRNNRYDGPASSMPWTPEWLRRTSPIAVVAMAEHRQRAGEPEAEPSTDTRSTR